MADSAKLRPGQQQLASYPSDRCRPSSWGTTGLRFPETSIYQPHWLRRAKGAKTKHTGKWQRMQREQDQEDNAIHMGNPKRDLRMGANIGRHQLLPLQDAWVSIFLWAGKDVQTPCLHPHCIPFTESYSLCHLLPLRVTHSCQQIQHAFPTLPVSSQYWPLVQMRLMGAENHKTQHCLQCWCSWEKSKREAWNRRLLDFC